MLEGKNILLGVCGSIASYKSATLIRLLVKAGANVKVIMTEDATHFITPLTLSTLSKNPVYFKYFNSETGEWNNHVELASWADLFLVAPASANTISKFSNGYCDNLLTATYLSAKSIVYYAPAMDLDMWKQAANQNNIKRLSTFGNIVINPGFGELASGLIGEGRMAEPEEIVDFLIAETQKTFPLEGKKVLVTAGPTFEAIDPVRYIGNHSSGRMGFSLAEELAEMGAAVTLISGPSNLSLNNPSIKRIDVFSSSEMAREVFQLFPESDITIMSAAVADYTPKVVESTKIKKEATEFTLELKKTTDILSAIGSQKKTNQILVGFALETDHEEANAIKKLEKKNLDFIVLNSLRDEGAGFKGEQNKITIIDKTLRTEHFELKSKKEVAKDICKKVIELL